MSPIILALFGAIAAALGTIFAKIGVKDIDSNTLTAVRSLVMAGIVTLAAIYFEKLSFAHLSAISGRSWFYLILSGLGGALSWIFFFHALAGGPLITITVIDRLSLLFTAVLAMIILSERISISAGVGLIMISIGTILVAIPWEKLLTIFK